jgi:CubicO group peptidase (beta-lactamase class C family)
MPVTRKDTQPMTSASTLPRSTPEAQGIASQAILDFVQALDRRERPLEGVQGLMLLRHGHVVAEGWWEPYGPDLPHSLFSLSKSFTSTAIGLAVAEGLLTVDDYVLSFFPEDAPPDPSPNLRAMTVRHLLSMNTGHHEDTTQAVFKRGIPATFGDLRGTPTTETEPTWASSFLSLPVEHEPGTWFVYNTGATYMLSAIITKLTGQPLVEYLRPRLFEPLGIANPVWDADPRGISLGGSGLHLRLEEIARFGQLYLQNGEWNGAQLVPADWIAEATAATSDNSNTPTNPDWMVGYGYQFWRCRPNAYRGDGAFGQFMVVMPEQDAVLVINSGLMDMQAVLDKTWDHILPAFGQEALPADPDAESSLRETLANLALPLPEGAPTSPRAGDWSGQEYALNDNDFGLTGVALTFGDDRVTLVVRDAAGEHPIEIGTEAWLPGTTTVRGHGAESVATSGAWTAEDTYEARLCFTESETCLTCRFHLGGDELRLEIEPNVSWEGPEPHAITGRVAAVAG